MIFSEFIHPCEPFLLHKAYPFDSSLPISIHYCCLVWLMSIVHVLLSVLSYFRRLTCFCFIAWKDRCSEAQFTAAQSTHFILSKYQVESMLHSMVVRIVSIRRMRVQALLTLVNAPASVFVPAAPPPTHPPTQKKKKLWIKDIICSIFILS